MTRILLALLALLPLTAKSLDLDTGKPAKGWSIAVTDFEGDAALTGDRVTVPKPANPRVPNSHVAARRGDDGAVTLQFTNTWIAQLRWQGGPPLDLRAYVPTGTVEFDLDVVDLARGGMKFKLGCGQDCERKIPFLFAGRALAGKGRQHLSFALKCFARDVDDFSAVNVPFALEGTGDGEVRIANLRLNKTGTPTTACPDYRTQSVTPERLQESWAVDWWLPRHEQKLAEIRAHRDAGRRVDLVFLGDSITQGWENEGQAAWAQHFAKHNAVALGFGGDRTENLLWRLRHGELDGMVIDELAARRRESFRAHKANARVVETWLRPGGAKLVLAKPNSFMNVSGGPVSGVARFYAVDPERVVVVHDELDIPFDTIKLKVGGGHGGHNGVRDVAKALATPEFPRVRVGIGRPVGRQDPADWVLDPFGAKERETLPILVSDAADAVELLVEDGLVTAQQRFHAPR